MRDAASTHIPWGTTLAHALLKAPGMRRLCLLLALLSGCDLYWNGGDDAPCQFGGADDQAFWEGQNLRNPDSGQCEIVGGGGGGGGCGGSCGPCAYEGDTATPPVLDPDWGACFSDCSNLGPDACMAAAGCRATFSSDANDALTDFLGCWAVAPSGPVEGGGCVGLDAHACSMHDDCTATYSPGGFLACHDEPGTTGGCAATDCAPGSHCEEQCYPCDSADGTACPAQCQEMCVPDTNGCAATDCGPGYECALQCEVMDPTMRGDSAGQCWPTCVPTGGGGDPGSCTGPVTCDAVGPTCPGGTTAGIANGCFTGYCIPLADCGPHDPGSCTGLLACAMPSPACPAGTTPGIANGCYTGYCIPDSACPLPACETLTTEATCGARGDCTPVYIGTDCTCELGTCTCTTLTYDRCESTVMAL